MELRVSLRRPRMSYESNPDDKEISDDDDDRNHKHRRRDDPRSQSSEDAVREYLFAKPYRRGSKPFQNGHLYGETGSQSNETWKRYSFNPLDKDISVKLEQKLPGLTHYSREPSDFNQKSRVNRPLHGDLGAFRGSGRDSSQWSPYESRFSSVDIASQMVQQRSVPHSLFAGTGLTPFSSSHSQSWGPSGSIPGKPNGRLDMSHPFGLQGSYRPVNTSFSNMGLERQQCRDFEEQGFCLRGDMCPMEHGMNRIVIEDVQGLSQFNLPISLANANLSIAPVGTGPTLATSVVTKTLSSSKGPHGKNIKRDVGDADSAADFYDPDQPLWSNDSHTSTGIQSRSQSSVGKYNSLLDHGLSEVHHVGQSDGSDNEPVTSSGHVASLKARSSVQNRIISIKNRTEIRGNIISKASPSKSTQNETTSNGRMNHKPSQKAHCTLFINGIPNQNNKRELLLSHFKKFGDVINIYAPLNSERAFVQFSKREEAEAALVSPDAVMGNRFIKLWWANRDIHDIQTVSSVNSVANKRKDDFHTVSKGSRALLSASDHPKVVDGTKVTQPLQKKLELMKEELRKKQEMLDQKRNEFRHKLDTLEKRASGTKGEQLANKQKVGISAISVEAAPPSERDAIVPSAQDEVPATSSKSLGSSGKQSSKTHLAIALPESSTLKPSPLSLVNLGSPVVNNRFKLDNRPTAFKVVPPLPDGLAKVLVLKEHFSLFGDLSDVQLDDPETSKVTAQIYFRTRHAAEKAFLGGKSWKGHSLQFEWLNSSNSRKDDVTRQNPLPFSKDYPKTVSQQPYTSGDADSEKNKGTASVTGDAQPCENHLSNRVSENLKQTVVYSKVQ